MQIILNEKEYAERCIQEGSIGENTWQTAQILSKYYYHELGFRKARIQKALTEFLEMNDPLFKRSVRIWEENIEWLAAHAGKYELYQQRFVPVTQTEFDTIRGCGLSKQHQQVLFVYLCLAKLGNMRNPKCNGWVNYGTYKTKDVFRLAHVSMTEEKEDYLINDLYCKKLLDLPMKNDNLSVRVTFCDMESDPVLCVTDFREPGYLYLKATGENIVACQQCGILIRGNKNGTKKYCNDCSGYTPQRTKQIACIDCGRLFEVSAKNTRTVRCQQCQMDHRREYYRERKKIPHSN